MSQSIDQIRSALDEVQAVFRTNYSQKSTEAVVDQFWSQDAYYTNSAATVEGRKDLIDFISGAYAAFSDVNWDTVALQQVTEDVVCLIADINHVHTDGNVDNDRAIMIFRKEQQGWLCAVDFVA